MLHRTFILLHSCLTRSDKHIVTVVVQQAAVSSNQHSAPEKLETHATAIQGFWIVKPLWRLWGIFTKITEFCEQCWQQSLAQPLTMMKHCKKERCPAPHREIVNGYDERVSPAPWVWRTSSPCLLYVLSFSHPYCVEGVGCCLNEHLDL